MNNVKKFLGRLDIEGLRSCLEYLKNEINKEYVKLKKKLNLFYIILFATLLGSYLIFILFDFKGKVVFAFVTFLIILIEIFYIVKLQRQELKILQIRSLTNSIFSRILKIIKYYQNLDDPILKEQKHNDIELILNKYFRKLSRILNRPIDELKSAFVNKQVLTAM